MKKMKIEYEIQVRNGKVIINISKEDFIKLFRMSLNNFCEEIDKIEEEAKSMYFTGRLKNEN